MLQTSGFRIQTYDLIDLPHRIDCSDQQDRKNTIPNIPSFPIASSYIFRII